VSRAGVVKVLLSLRMSLATIMSMARDSTRKNRSTCPGTAAGLGDFDWHGFQFPGITAG